MATRSVGILLLVLLLIGYCSGENDPCSRKVKDDSFTQFMESMNCRVDEKLLNLLTDDKLFTSSIKDNKYANFMCIGFMGALALVPENMCDVFDPLGEIPGGDFCASTTISTLRKEIVNGSVFDNTSNIFIVSKFTEENCEVLCKDDTGQLCWAFGIIAKVVLKRALSITVPPSVTTTTVTTPTTKPTESSDLTLPPLHENNIPKKPESGNGTDGSKSNKEVVDEQHNDDSTDNSNEVSDKPPTSITDPSDLGQFFGISKNISSVKENEVERGDKPEDDKKNNVIIKNNSTENPNEDPSDNPIEDPSDNPTEPSDNPTGHEDPSDVVPKGNDTDQIIDDNQTLPIGELGGDGNQTVNSTEEPVVTDTDTDTDIKDQDGNDKMVDGKPDDYDDDSDSKPADSTDQTPDQSKVNFDDTIGDDDDDDGYSYWHFAAILLFILFLGVAGYLASLNRKKIRESVSTYMSKRKRKREYKPVNTMEAGLS